MKNPKAYCTVDPHHGGPLEHPLQAPELSAQGLTLALLIFVIVIAIIMDGGRR